MPGLKIHGYPLQPPACVEYDPRAADVARRVIRKITRALPSVLGEHVGSTAVPGCAGKGIVDLMVVYPQGQLDAVKQALEILGFQKQTFGHIHPESRPMRVGALLHKGQTFRVHVHVVAADSPEVETILGFRDLLRRDPDLVAAYVRCKHEILHDRITDPSAYTERKSLFVQEILHNRIQAID